MDRTSNNLPTVKVETVQSRRQSLCRAWNVFCILIDEETSVLSTQVITRWIARYLVTCRSKYNLRYYIEGLSTYLVFLVIY